MSENYSIDYLKNTLTENWVGPSRLMLCNTAIWSADPTSEQIFASEIPQANGYSRLINTPVAAATYNSTTKEAEITMANVSPTAAGGNIVYSGYAILRKGSVGTANKVATAVSASNQIACTAHGLTNGDRVMLTADAGATLPTGLNGLTFYYASVVDAGNIQLFAEPALTTLQTFTTNGSGTLRLRYCQGEDGPRKNLGSDRTIADGNSHVFNGLKAYAY